MKNHIVLFEPQIPANTGNISRTCAGTDTHLHLIRPLGFKTDDKHLKRAGLDYWQHVDITYHENLEAFMNFLDGRPLFLVSKFANKVYSDVDYASLDEVFLMFGKETTGLPETFMREHAEKAIRLPMDDQHVRSLNLSNAVSIVLYEVLRQQKFPNLELQHHYENDKID
ncbi:tRNA (uridine(34)/cytosine(34)/5-carboxymethylaminomethyluridine(34)-2'-O)-methyltransferase TrmL [Atopobacter phocae]|uniref:tRNA (uridine(34)/cytosine(34)/5- carboxymethylaminomethyluridine(34)-2'-O)- methyltransferase TrmL n=1 Tax=Atopobacter phocae TaxID=136492 RepID=UPI0004726CD3|nr:tRNA (uridine(34)/cytosine(34)/5-carboxymethylaminomethyluridine(34)-2'-O)-methyltransferase TrmL [Atopobacter phocae]